MMTMEKALENCKVLKGWDGYDVKLDLEENPDDIWMAIKYSDHGDEYLIVGTKDRKVYKYGCFVNLKWYNYMSFIRKPVLYKELDEMGIVSNKIFFELERILQKSHMSFGYDKKYNTIEGAQWAFDHIIQYMTTMANESKAFFDYDNKKGRILVWMALNNIDNKDNIRMLNETAFHNKIGKNKVIGVSGKEDISNYENLIVDEAEFIYVNGKEIDPNKILTYYSSDEWGFDSMKLCLKGFRPSKARA